jgi:hypothetical protein
MLGLSSVPILQDISSDDEEEEEEKGGSEGSEEVKVDGSSSDSRDFGAGDCRRSLTPISNHQLRYKKRRN